MRINRSLGAGRGRRRILTSLFASVLAVGATVLPATPAFAWTCKANALLDPSASQIQTLLDVGGPSTVTFYGTCYGNFTIDRNVTVLGSGSATVAGDGGGSVFDISNGAIVTIRGLKITDGGEVEGGGIYLYDGASLRLDRVNMFGNDAEVGGAVFAADDTILTVVNSTFRDNSAFGVGGAIASDGGEFSVSGSTFLANEAEEGWGGAISIEQDDACAGTGVTISRSTFTGNTSPAGGAISIHTAEVVVSGSTFSRNVAVYEGGAIQAHDDDSCDSETDLTVTSSSFVSNSAGPGDGGPGFGSLGGAISVNSLGTFAVTGSRFTSNQAENGGAIGVWTYDDEVEEDDTQLNVTGSTFTSNTAIGYQGGAIWYDANNEEDGDSDGASIVNSTFTSNTAPWDGGAVYVADAEDVDITGSTFTRNATTFAYSMSLGAGGAVFIAGWDCETADVDITRSRFTSNTAAQRAGALGIDGDECMGQVTISGSTFTTNRSNVDGGAVYLYDVDTEVVGTTFSGNQTTFDGGAIVLSGDDAYAGQLETDRATRFVNNKAGDDGGAIVIDDGRLLFSGVATGNTAFRGGALWVYADNWLSQLEISAATIERNVAVAQGGGIWFLEPDGSAGDFYVYDDIGYADAIGDDINGTPSVGPVSISYNRVTGTLPWQGLGGGIYVEYGADFQLLTLYDSTPGSITIQRNSAVNDGGGIYVYDCDLNGTFTLEDGVLIQYNTTGGVYANDFIDYDGASYVSNAVYDLDDGNCGP